MAGTGGGDCKGVTSGAMLVSWHPQHEALSDTTKYPSVYKQTRATLRLVMW